MGIMEQNIRDLLNIYSLTSKEQEKMNYPNYQKDMDEFKVLLEEYTKEFRNNGLLDKVLKDLWVFNSFLIGNTNIKTINNFLLTQLNYDNRYNLSIEEQIKIVDDFFTIIYLYHSNKSNYLYYLSDSNIIVKIWQIYIDANNKIINDDLTGELKDAFLFTLYRNLSFVLGEKFDIHNYDYDKVKIVIEDMFYTFIMDPNVQSYAVLNDLGSHVNNDNRIEMKKLLYEYCDLYIKKMKQDNPKKKIL